MLLAENVSYGFWRNMRGLRPTGMAVSVATAIGDAAPLYRAGTADDRFWPRIAVAAGCCVALIAWLFLVTRRAVEDASLAYAKRLFAQIDNPVVNERLRAASLSKAA